MILPGVWLLVLLCWILGCWHREKQSCSNKWLRSLISLFRFHSHRPKRSKNTSCIFIHKIINSVNIGFCCLYNQLQFTYCLPEWVEKYVRQFPSFPLSNYSVFSWGTSCAQLKSATQNFSVLLFHSESLRGPLSRVPLPPFVCVELHLKCCNTKIEQTAWNETWGLFVHVLRHR